MSNEYLSTTTDKITDQNKTNPEYLLKILALWPTSFLLITESPCFTTELRLAILQLNPCCIKSASASYHDLVHLSTLKWNNIMCSIHDTGSRTYADVDPRANSSCVFQTLHALEIISSQILPERPKELVNDSFTRHVSYDV